MEKIKSFVEKYKWIIVSTFIWGVLAHGYMYLNKLSFLDDVVSMESVGATYTSGRWLLGILDKVMKIALGGSYSTPLLIGTFTLIIAVVINILLVKIFDITNKYCCWVMCGIVVLFPSMTALYSFMFTAGYYMISILLSVLAVYVLLNCKNVVYGELLGISCICLAMGIYQAYVGFSILCFLFVFILKIIDDDQASYKELLKTGISYAVCIAGGALFYLVINKIALYLTASQMTSYRGMDQMYSKQVFHLDFKFLLQTLWAKYDNMLYYNVWIENTLYIYRCVLIVVIAVILFKGIQLIIHKKLINACLMILALICVPVALNPFALCNVDMVHYLMLFPKCIIFIFFIALVSRSDFSNVKVKKTGIVLGIVLILYTNIYYTYYANRCYLGAEFNRQETISWMTTLITQIKSIDGFDENMRIAYLGGAEDITFYRSKVALSKEERFYGGDLRRDYVWKDYMEKWCGFNMTEVDGDTYNELNNMECVNQMPNYPADGSIEVVGDIVVVKF